MRAYVMLERWGTMTFGEVLAPAIDMADERLSAKRGLAGSINGSKKASQISE